MKAAVYYENGDPSVLKYEEVADPECHPKGIVIRVEAVSIEGGDVLNRWRGALTARPHVVGYQAAGEIVEVGAEAGDLKVGQKVATVGASGSHAELRAVPSRERLAHSGRFQRRPSVRHAGDLRHRSGMPVRIRRPESRRNGPDPGRGRRGGRGGHPAGQARRGDGDRDRVQRRAVGAPHAPGPRPRHQLQARGRRRVGDEAHRRQGRRPGGRSGRRRDPAGLDPVPGLPGTHLDGRRRRRASR